jgi:hypothetical protein
MLVIIFRLWLFPVRLRTWNAYNGITVGPILFFNEILVYPKNPTLYPTALQTHITLTCLKLNNEQRRQV